MKISRENYELFFIDYFDGNLTDQQIADLENFLLLNPDLREEMDGMEKVNLVPHNINFFDKDILRKIDNTYPLSKENFDDYCVAYIEGDLNNEEADNFELFIETYPEHKKDLELYRDTIISPDFSIVYKEKNKLKKSAQVIKRMPLYSAFTIAATIALLILFFRVTESPDKKTVYLAEKPEPVKSEQRKPDLPQDYLQKESTTTFLTVIENPTSTLENHIIHSSQKDTVQKLSSETEILASNEIKDQELNFAQINLPVVNIRGARPDHIKGLNIQGEKTVEIQPGTETEYLSIPDIALKFVADKVLRREEPIPDPSKLTLWDVADAGINGINRLTGSEMKLEKQSGNDGEVKAISFDAGFLSFTRPVR